MLVLGICKYLSMQSEMWNTHIHTHTHDFCDAIEPKLFRYFFYWRPKPMFSILSVPAKEIHGINHSYMERKQLHDTIK